MNHGQKTKGVRQLKKIRFVIGNNNNYFRLEIAKTLLRFTEFDFTFFWEQCINAGKTAHKTGNLPQELMSAARSAVSGCHPYIEACVGGNYDSVAVDCIIAYICSSEHIGLEELWARCITPKNNYESAIFRRISEYKTGRAVNQWVNIVRMGEYAKAKMEFIYGGDPFTFETMKARKEYFDLAFSVSANELGYPVEDMPAARIYNRTLIPGAAFRMGQTAKKVYHTVGDMIKNVPQCSVKGHNQVLSDQSAMDVFSYIKNLERPADSELNMLSEILSSDEAEEVYMPSGFKALIDLEFDLMMREGVFLRECRNCGRYFICTSEEDGYYCGRVTASGKSCRQIEEEKRRPSKIAPEDMLVDDKPAEVKEEKPADESKAHKHSLAEQENVDGFFDGGEDYDILLSAWELEEKKTDAPHEQSQKAEKPVEKSMINIPEAAENRSQEIYSKLYRSIGKAMSESEFKEWAQYLSDLMGNVRSGDGTLSQLEEFLGSAEKLYEERMSVISEEEEQFSEFSPQRFERAKLPPKKKISREELYAAAREAGLDISDGNQTGSVKFAEPAKQDEVPEKKYTGDGREYKPFMPKKYASLYEAMMDNPKKEDDEPARVIRKPQWERIKK